MSTPNFRRGAPPPSAPTGPPSPARWIAKYGGTCEYCQASIEEGMDRVQWNEDRTAVVCASHRVIASD